MARKPSEATIRVGISGWVYPPWRGTFYPAKLTQARELAYAAERLSGIEVNGTFYSMLRPESFAKWYGQTPADFVFALKAPKFITHVRKLRDVAAPVANFILSGPLRLREKLGPLLWQLPPKTNFEPDVMEAFLAALPHSTAEAAKLVKQADATRMKGRLYAEVDRDRPLRHAIEVRDHRFATDAFVRLLRKYKVAAVTGDTTGNADWPMLRDLTADFAYLRLHGETAVYPDGYTDAALADWAKRIGAIARGGDVPAKERLGPAAAKQSERDVYVFCDVANKVHAPQNAMRLAEILTAR